MPTILKVALTVRGRGPLDVLGCVNAGRGPHWSGSVGEIAVGTARFVGNIDMITARRPDGVVVV